MRRVLVPLDGTQLAESILPDARRLAGPDGELVLLRDASGVRYDRVYERYDDEAALKEGQHYLERVAERLRANGARVSVHVVTPLDVAWAIDGAAQFFKVDMVACATHGRGPLGRLLHGSVAWKALANSPVPILLRHVEAHPSSEIEGAPVLARKIMVPLDGSEFGEYALPLASQLAEEWSAPVDLVQVVPDVPIPDTRMHRATMEPYSMADEVAEAREYLDRMAERLPGEVHRDVFVGPPLVDPLVRAVRDWGVTDVVMASHGRTGLARVILGSVADEMIHRLRVPVIVIPAMAVESNKRTAAGPEVFLTAR